MLRRLLAPLVACVVLCVPMLGQAPAGFLRVGQTALLNADGSPVSNATACGQVMLAGRPASVQVNGSATVSFSQACTPVVNGAWFMNLPDMSLSVPRYAGINLQITDDVSGNALLSGYSYIQPRSVPPLNIGGIFWCSLSGCDLGLLPPNYPASDVFVSSPGPQGLTGSNVPLTDQNLAANTTAVLQTSTALQSLLNASIQKLNGVDAREVLTSARPALLTWLFSAKYANSTSPAAQRQRVVFLTDSQGICDQTACPGANGGSGTGPYSSVNRYPERVRLALQKLYGYGGTGLQPVINRTANQINPEWYSYSGSAVNVDLRMGPQESVPAATAGGSVLKMASGDVLTWTPGLPYDTVNVACISGGGSSLAVKVDGASQGSVCGSGTGNAAQIQASNTFAFGNHQTTLTCSGGPCYVYGVDGTAGSKGIEVDELGVGGATSAWWSGPGAFAWVDLLQPYVALTVTHFGTNDQAYGVPVSTYQANLATMFQHQRSSAVSGVNASSELAVIPYASNSFGPTYTAAALATAHANGTDIVNPQDEWGTAPSSFITPDGIHAGDVFAPELGAMVLSHLVNEPAVTLPRQLNLENPAYQGCEVYGASATPTESAQCAFFTAAGSTATLPNASQGSFAGPSGFGMSRTITLYNAATGGPLTIAAAAPFVLNGASSIPALQSVTCRSYVLPSASITNWFCY